MITVTYKAVLRDAEGRDLSTVALKNYARGSVEAYQHQRAMNKEAARLAALGTPAASADLTMYFDNVAKWITPFIFKADGRSWATDFSREVTPALNKNAVEGTDSMAGLL